MAALQPQGSDLELLESLFRAAGSLGATRENPRRPAGGASLAPFDSRMPGAAPAGDPWIDPQGISLPTFNSEARREMREYLAAQVHAPSAGTHGHPGHGHAQASSSAFPQIGVPPRAELPQFPRTPATDNAPSTASHAAPSQFAQLLGGFNHLKSQIQQELENHLHRLLTLNMSRREAIAEYLERLAGGAPAQASLGAHPARGAFGHAGSPTSTAAGLYGAGTGKGFTRTGDAAAVLRRWIEGPRSPAQNGALHAYFEEVALITLGQALLLKAWNDRGMRNWSEADLRDLNYVINHALKSKVPLDRETWQVARQNIYSWYKPSPLLQGAIWQTLESWRIAGEGPGYLVSLFGMARQARPEGVEPQGYDSRFFKSLWENMAGFGFDPAANPGPIRRNWIAFSPTLRDGAVVRNGPLTVSWVGTETSPFQLMVAELMQLWWGIATPPLWAIGNGLEAHTRDQLSLNLTSPKPSLITRITEMEACDVAFVLEEKVLRGQARTPQAQKYVEQCEGLPYFKKLRAAGTSLGDLQACVTLTKLRPGGLMWWAREEPLSSHDGGELLNFLLERGKLVAEWDFSGIEHGLPVTLPLFPRYLYLWAREPRVEERLTHRPARVRVQGQVRSHVEIPVLLEDSLRALRQLPPARAQWKITAQASPTPQKEWAERWPDPACQQTMQALDRLREASLALANAVTVRSTPKGSADRNGGWVVHPSNKGLWIHAEGGIDGRRLVAQPLPRPGKTAQGAGVMLLVPDESWVAPLRNYLESAPVRQWLEHHAERRGDRWVLTEQLVKWIPVPKALLLALGFDVNGAAGNGGEPRATGAPPSENAAPAFARPLPGEWEKIAAEIVYQPRLALEALKGLDTQSPAAAEIRAEFFVRASRALEHLLSSQGAFLALVTREGRIRWSELLKILPGAECMAITLHPRVRISGTLPPHLAIGFVDRVNSPSPGILFATESGFNLHLASDSPLVLDMIVDQLDGLSSPTWSELVGYLKLPRRLEVAEAAASDVLRSHGEQARRVNELTELLTACQLH